MIDESDVARLYEYFCNLLGLVCIDQSIPPGHVMAGKARKSGAVTVARRILIKELRLRVWMNHGTTPTKLEIGDRPEPHWVPLNSGRIADLLGLDRTGIIHALKTIEVQND